MIPAFLKFVILYFCMILFFVLRYYITSELKAYEMYNYSSEMIWIWYLRNAINVLYYILELLLLFALCNTENYSSVLECILIIPVALISCFASIFIIDPFSGIYANSEYFIPFGTMLFCALLCRWYKKHQSKN